jgi:hypothetical protein
MAWQQFGHGSGTRMLWCKGTSRCAMEPDGAAVSSQRGSARARLEGGRTTRIAPMRDVKPKQRKGDGFGRVTGAVAGRVHNGFRP